MHLKVNNRSASVNQNILICDENSYTRVNKTAACKHGFRIKTGADGGRVVCVLSDSFTVD